ncbi:MAG: type III pantothenate kinase [Coriobacteriia bacterium]|nr:type III pantothenate kinase [Coriobacteriia bacterium]MCL2870336.1 type III pantothenate kinase [Coriobacteriia bacterium]
MLLAVDIGNTQTVLGLFEGAELRHTWRLASDVARTRDEVGAIVTHLFLEAERQGQSSFVVNQMVIASVVPALTRTWIELAQNMSCLKGVRKPLIVDSAIARHYSRNIVNPAEIGADRIANAIAARMLYGAPAIVVDFGTATNIDVIDSQGYYIGGIISPGIQASANALFSSAARLPAVDLELPEYTLGTTTKAAVQSGLLRGEAAKVDALIWALRQENPILARPGIAVVATGGLASRILQATTQITHHDPDLTLKGLYLIAVLQIEGQARGRTEEQVRGPRP